MQAYWINQGGISMTGGYRPIISCSRCGFVPSDLRDQDHPPDCLGCGAAMQAASQDRPRIRLPGDLEPLPR